MQQTTLSTKPRMSLDEMNLVMALIRRMSIIGENVNAQMAIQKALTGNFSANAKQFIGGLLPWAFYIGGDSSSAKNAASRVSGNGFAQKCWDIAKTYERSMKVLPDEPRRRKQWLSAAISLLGDLQNDVRRHGPDDGRLRSIEETCNLVVIQSNLLTG